MLLRNFDEPRTENSVDTGNSLLITQRHQVNRQHLPGQHQPRRASIQQSRPYETHRGPIIHGRSRDIERETRDGLIHQDAEIIAQVRARDAERPCRAEDEDVAEGDQGVGDIGHEWLGEEGMGGLVAEGALEESVAEEAEGEDGEGKGVAGELGAVVEEVGEGFVVVFWQTFRRAAAGVV